MIKELEKSFTTCFSREFKKKKRVKNKQHEA